MWSLLLLWRLVRRLRGLELSCALETSAKQYTPGGYIGLQRATHEKDLMVPRSLLAGEFRRYWTIPNDNRFARNYESVIYRNQQIISEAIGRGLIKELPGNKGWICLSSDGYEFCSFTAFFVHAARELKPLWRFLVVLGVTKIRDWFK